MKKKVFVIILFLIFAMISAASGVNPENLNSTAFAYYFTGSFSCTLIKFKINSPSTPTIIGSPQPNSFGEGDWANPEGSWNYYVIETSGTPAVFRVDTATGTTTNLGNITGLLSGHSIIFMSWDHVTNKFYFISTFTSAAQLYSLNWATKSLTTIGAPITVCTSVAFGGFSGSGILYVVDAVTDYVFKINKITGSATQLGPSGYNYLLNTAGAFDRSDWYYYSIPSNGSLSSLFRLDSNLIYIQDVGSIPFGNIKALCIATPPVTSVNVFSSEIPDSYKLLQNFPNPFNPNTIIRFKIKDSRFVSLKIYNLLGSEVSTLVNENLNAGEYETVFDASKLSSGVYYYKITVVNPLGRTENFTDTRKMLLIK